MKITVILCTYNRCQSLAKALHSVAASVVPPSVDWEVLVVDNNSKDQTREVVEEFIGRYGGRFRYLFEPQQGKSYALNSGIRESRGEVLAFMDDDVTVEPTWLSNLTAPLKEGGWSGSGGRIRPAGDFSPPRWLPLTGPDAMVGILCAQFDLGDEGKKLDQPPYGANMAFYKSLFEKYGYFRTDIGPRPGSEIRNEDTEFGRRLLAGGEPLRYVPSAVVFHEVAKNRLRKEYFLTWWFDYGRADIREARAKPPILGISRHYASALRCGFVLVPINALRWIFTWNPRRRFSRKCFVWMVAGATVEAYRRSFGAKSARASDDAVQQKNEP